MSNNKSKMNLRRLKARKKFSSGNKSKTNAQIERINELSKMARGTWFSLLGYLAFVGVTLLAVQDADFFIEARKTQLPIVNIPIPTASFFIFGPILGTALFVYLHLYLIRLWDALAQTPAKIGDLTLSEAVMPWLINDFGLWLRNDDAFKKRPMDWLSHLVTALLVFIAAPFIMGYFWVRHWPSHDLWISYGLAFLFSLTLIVALASFLTARQRLKFKTDYQTGRHYIVVIPFICFISLTLATSFLKTEGSEWHQKENEYRSKPMSFINEPKLLSYWFWYMDLAKADMAEAELIEKPTNWQSYADERVSFRKRFCKSEGLSPLECGPISNVNQTPSNAQQAARLKWAEKLRLKNQDRIQFFNDLDHKFETDWKTAHKSLISALPKLNLSKRDLRNANLSKAFFANANLRNAHMQGAHFSEAEMQGADLGEAEMQGAVLWIAQLQGANLFGAELQGAGLFSAQLQGADLGFAKLQGANLFGAQLQGADLGEAKLQGADLGEAQLQGANLFGAELQGADLRSAQLQGADLRSAQLQGADLFGAELQGVNLGSAKIKSVKWAGATIHSSAHFTDLRGSIGLTQDMLENVIGNEDTLLFATEEGRALHVWSCWLPDKLPASFEKLLKQNAWQSSIEKLRAQWVCSDDNPRVPTGTTKPLDAE